MKRDEKRKATTICFLVGNAEQLAELAGKSVAVAGRQYWLKGEEYPVLIPERFAVRREER